MDCPIEVVGDGVVMETIKPAEDGSGVIVRLFENKGKDVTASVKTAFKCDAYGCDMLENTQDKVDLGALTFRPWEIKTVLLKTH